MLEALISNPKQSPELYLMLSKVISVLEQNLRSEKNLAALKTVGSKSGGE